MKATHASKIHTRANQKSRYIQLTTNVVWNVEWQTKDADFSIGLCNTSDVAIALARKYSTVCYETKEPGLIKQHNIYYPYEDDLNKTIRAIELRSSIDDDPIAQIECIMIITDINDCYNHDRLE